MVTTRSADRRATGSAREEDLVLRSRKIVSPASYASTPSKLGKRSTQRHQNDSPRPKRARTGLDGTTDDGGSSGQEALGLGEHSVATETPVIATTPTETTKSRSAGSDVPSKVASTPQHAIRSSASKPDVFKTPATTKHKRFDSEEPEEDTIIVNQSSDSSPQTHYQTADEEISDSDEAPEISTIQNILAKPPRRKARGTKGKPTAEAIAVNNGPIAPEETQAPTFDDTIKVSQPDEQVKPQYDAPNNNDSFVDQDVTVLGHDTSPANGTPPFDAKPLREGLLSDRQEPPTSIETATTTTKAVKSDNVIADWPSGPQHQATTSSNSTLTPARKTFDMNLPALPQQKLRHDSQPSADDHRAPSETQ